MTPPRLEVIEPRVLLSASSVGWELEQASAGVTGGEEVAAVACSTGEPGNLPTADWSTYLGGGDNDYGYDVARDRDGNIYIVGTTASDGWANGGYDTILSGESDTFLVKLSPSGEFLWSAYIGGEGAEPSMTHVAIDREGNLYVSGSTESDGWISGGWDTTYGGQRDGFLLKLSPSGQPLWSTYVGGENQEYGRNIAIDSQGNVVLVGSTYSAGWIPQGPDTTQGGDQDGFLLKFSPDGNLLWGSYLGGELKDDGWGIAVDGSDNVVASGTTKSEGWVAGGYDTQWDPAGIVAFVAKFTPSGESLWSTYVGDYYTRGLDVVCDGLGNILVTGETTGGDAPGWVTGGYDVASNEIYQTFVAKISPRGEHVWSTYVDIGWMGFSVAVDARNNVLVTGIASPMPGAISGSYRTGLESWLRTPYLVKVSSEGVHLSSGYLDGMNTGHGYGLAVDSRGEVVMVGYTIAADWVQGGYDTTLDGQYDGFVIKFSGLADPLRPGDFNADGAVNVQDINPFLLAMTDLEEYLRRNPRVVLDLVDLNGDGLLNTQDIDPFAALIATGPPAPEASTLPVTDWSSYLGGTGWDQAFRVVTDAWGNIYVTGSTNSYGWISGGYNTLPGGDRDGFVVKLSPTGVHLWSTYIGGSGDDYVYDLAVDGQGNVVALCVANAISVGPRTTRPGLLVVKLNAAGQEVWTAKLPGTTDNHSLLNSTRDNLSGRRGGVAIDSVGDIYVTDWATNPDLRVDGYDQTHSGTIDSVLYKFSSAGQVIWSTFLGGDGEDYSTGIAVDGQDNVVVMGVTTSAGWASGGYDTTQGGMEDGFVIKLSPSGGLLWSTYLGGDKDDAPAGLAVDADGNILVAGTSGSPAWISGGFDTYRDGPGNDPFLVKLDANGGHVWSTYYGSGVRVRWSNLGRAVVIDAAGNIRVAGSEYRDLFTYGPVVSVMSYVFSPTGEHLWSWSTEPLPKDYGGFSGMAIDGRGDVLAVGATYLEGWISGGYDTTFGGGDWDGSLVKFTCHTLLPELPVFESQPLGVGMSLEAVAIQEPQDAIAGEPVFEERGVAGSTAVEAGQGRAWIRRTFGQTPRLFDDWAQGARSLRVTVDPLTGKRLCWWFDQLVGEMAEAVAI